MANLPEVFTKRLTFQLGSGGNAVNRWVYVALIKGERNCLVDTGTSVNFSEIVDFCGHHGVRVDEIDLIINTHCHPDHIGGNLLFKEANPRIAFYAHRLARPEIEDIDRQFRRRPLPGFYDLVSGPVTIDRELEDHDEFDVGTKVEVLHTPGHSSGSISLSMRAADLLLTGDSVPGRTDVPIYEDVAALRSTIDRLENTGASRVISAFDGECGPISDVTRLGQGVIARVDAAVRSYLKRHTDGQRASAAVTQPDPVAVCRFVLDELGFSSTPPLPIIVASIRTHLRYD